jgi:hypothetical protein
MMRKPLFYRLKKIFPNGTTYALYYDMKNETFTLENEKMTFEIIYTSDCCGAYLSDAHVEHGICPECAEHCEVNKEEILVTPVCGG